MKTIEKLTQNALTETQAPSTKESPVNTGEWAKWFRFQLFNDPQLEQMVNLAARFVMNIKTGGDAWVVLLGTSGAGKSYLAQRIFEWWNKSGMWYEGSRGENAVMRGTYCKWATFIKECREGGSSRIDDLCKDHLVILDDIGAGSDQKAWMVDKLYMILESRMSPEKRSTPISKATFITANISLEQLAAQYDQRIASRLLRKGADKVLEVDVLDYNLRRASAVHPSDSGR